MLQAVPTAKGQALADEYGIKFFETVCCLPDLHDTFSEQFFFFKLKNRVCSCFTLTDFCVFQSAKTNLNVEQVFFSIARDIKQRLAETDSKPEVQTTVHSYALHSTIHRVQCSERYMLAL